MVKENISRESPQFLLKMGITQKEIAEILGISVSTVSHSPYVSKKVVLSADSSKKRSGRDVFHREKNEAIGRFHLSIFLHCISIVL